MLRNDVVLTLRPGVLFWVCGHEYLLFDQIQMVGRFINSIGYEILEKLNGRQSLAGITQDIVGRHQSETVTAGLIEEAVLRFITFLRENHMLLEGRLREHLDRYWAPMLVQNLRTLGTPYRPGLCYWEVTKACNLRCPMCYDYAGSPRAGELNLEEGLAAIEELKAAGLSVIVFTGGEPTLRRDKLLRWIRAARDNEVHSELFTNGTHMDDDYAAALKDAGLGYTRVTVLGATAEVHDTGTGVQGSFAKTIRGIQALVSAGVPVCFQSVTNRHNFPQLRMMVETAIEMGCQGFRVGTLDFMGQGQEAQNMAPTPEQELSIWRFCAQSIVMYADRIRIGWGADICKEDAWRHYILEPSKDSVIQAPPPEVYMQYAKNSLCGVAIRSFAMTATGDITPCPALSGLMMGNIRNGDFLSIWDNGKYFRELREMSLDEYDDCSSCGVRYSCSGGCRALSYYRKGSLTKGDVRRCTAYRTLAEKGFDAVQEFYTAAELEAAMKKFRLAERSDTDFTGPCREGLGPWSPDNQMLIRLTLQNSPERIGLG